MTPSSQKIDSPGSQGTRLAARRGRRQGHNAECETRDGRIDRLERVIRLEGALAAADRAKLLEIAGKCPVHRTLRGEIDIPTRLLEE